MTNSDDETSRFSVLAEAMSEGDKQAIDRWIRNEQFTLVALAEDAESEEEGVLSALVVETEEFPAVVAFMSSEDAQRFVDSIADQIEGETVNLFEVDGDALLQPMSEDFGLLINPESDDAIMIEPSLLRQDDESEDLDDEESDA
ncbi:MAG: hypothetical protein ACK56W_02190 [Pirellula sp.]|jgi:hypothetical protein|nr:hypothetical protein [Pirellula sp.]